MESRSYLYPRCGKDVKSTTGLTRYINVCKISITLPSCQPSNLELMLDYNIINPLDLPSDNNKKNISPNASNNGKKGIRLADISNDEEDIRPANIDKERLATPNWTSQNRLLSELSSTFREVMFSECKFSVRISILDTKYKHSGSQNHNLFYPFNGQLDYLLAHYFVDSETTKHNVDKFLTNSFMKPITKDLS